MEQMRRWALAISCCAVALAQPRATANWTVSGTVVDSATAKPIPGAMVIWAPSFSAYGFKDRPLDSGPAANDARVSADASGAFALSVEATATAVRVFVSHAGFQASDGKPMASLSIAPRSAPVVIKLVAQSVIQGHVLSGSGSPLKGIEMRATRIEIRDGLRQPRETYTQPTNESGVYRFEDLRPGSYYLRASGSEFGSQTVYGPIYYPMSETQDKAEFLAIAPGKVENADFRLDAHKAFAIRGIIAKVPLRRALAIRLLRGNDPLSNSYSITPNGTFALSGVAPGSYTLQAYTPDVDPPSYGQVDLTVEDRDVSAVKVVLNEGVDIAGNVEFHGSTALTKYAVVYATPFNAHRFPINLKQPVATMHANGDFLFKNVLPGKYEISVRGLPDVYLADVRAVSRDVSKDVLENGLTVPDHDPPTLAIVMKRGGGEISGQIEGAKPGDVFMAALVIRHGVTDIPIPIRAQNGRFRVADLAPGDYTLLAWPESREIEYRNPAVLSGWMPYGTTVSLADGARRETTVAPLPLKP